MRRFIERVVVNTTQYNTSYQTCLLFQVMQIQSTHECNNMKYRHILSFCLYFFFATLHPMNKTKQNLIQILGCVISIVESHKQTIFNLSKLNTLFIFFSMQKHKTHYCFCDMFFVFVLFSDNVWACNLKRTPEKKQPWHSWVVYFPQFCVCVPKHQISSNTMHKTRS